MLHKESAAYVLCYGVPAPVYISNKLSLLYHFTIGSKGVFSGILSPFPNISAMNITDIISVTGNKNPYFAHLFNEDRTWPRSRSQTQGRVQGKSEVGSQGDEVGPTRSQVSSVGAGLAGRSKGPDEHLWTTRIIASFLFWYQESNAGPHTCQEVTTPLS